MVVSGTFIFQEEMMDLQHQHIVHKLNRRSRRERIVAWMNKHELSISILLAVASLVLLFWGMK